MFSSPSSSSCLISPPRILCLKAWCLSYVRFLLQKFLDALTELEQLKPAVQQRIKELNRKPTQQSNGWGYKYQNDLLERLPFNKKTLIGSSVTKVQLFFNLRPYLLFFWIFDIQFITRGCSPRSSFLFVAVLVFLLDEFVIFLLFYTGRQ